jgi:hypothetical protein
MATPLDASPAAGHPTSHNRLERLSARHHRVERQHRARLGQALDGVGRVVGDVAESLDRLGRAFAEVFQHRGDVVQVRPELFGQWRQARACGIVRGGRGLDVLTHGGRGEGERAGTGKPSDELDGRRVRVVGQLQRLPVRRSLDILPDQLGGESGELVGEWVVTDCER